jgi:DNA-binding transcriptional regulator LsrR (DeoR family)
MNERQVVTTKKQKSVVSTQDTEKVVMETPAERSLGSSRTRRMRLRAAWMYFIEEMTQNDIAQQLGVGRVTVVRLLTDARERNEVKFSIQGGLQECIAVASELEKRFQIDEVIVVPLSNPEADATHPISTATGMFLNEIVTPGLRIGVGWGRTLLESLAYINEVAIPNMSVVSLLGGITKVKQFNPSEFAWRFSNLFQAECYLMTAPAIVDSPATKKALIDFCGLGEVFERAQSLDAVLLSVGDLDAQGTPYRNGFVSESVRSAMLKQGAVGETLFNYFDAKGKLVKSSVSGCVMAVPLKTIANAPKRIIASGGVRKAEALLGAIRLVRPTVLVTDEFAARRILELDKKTH